MSYSFTVLLLTSSMSKVAQKKLSPSKNITGKPISESSHETLKVTSVVTRSDKKKKKKKKKKLQISFGVGRDTTFILKN